MMENIQGPPTFIKRPTPIKQPPPISPEGGHLDMTINPSLFNDWKFM